MSEGNNERPKRPRSAYNFFYRFKREKILGIGDCSVIDLESLQRVDKKKRVHRRGTHSLGFRELTARVSKESNALDIAARAPYNDLAARDKERYSKEIDEWRKKCKRSGNDSERGQEKEEHNYAQVQKMTDTGLSYEGHKINGENYGDGEESNLDAPNIPKWKEKTVFCQNTNRHVTEENKPSDEKIPFLFSTQGGDNESVRLKRPAEQEQFRETKRVKVSKENCPAEHEQFRETKTLTVSKRNCETLSLHTLQGDVLSNVVSFLDSLDVQCAADVCATLRNRLGVLLPSTCEVSMLSTSGTRPSSAYEMERITSNRRTEHALEELVRHVEQDPSNASSIIPRECGSFEYSLEVLSSLGRLSPLLSSRTERIEASDMTDQETPVPQKQHLHTESQQRQEVCLQLQPGTKQICASDHQDNKRVQEKEMQHVPHENRNNAMLKRRLKLKSSSTPIAHDSALGQNLTTKKTSQDPKSNFPTARRKPRQPATQNGMTDAPKGKNMSDRQIVVMLGFRLRDLERSQQQTWCMVQRERASWAAFRERTTRKCCLLEEAIAIEKQQLVDTEKEVKELKSKLLIQSRGNGVCHTHFNSLTPGGRWLDGDS